MKKKVIIGLAIFLVILLILGFYLNYIYNIKGNFLEANNKDELDKLTMTIKEGTLTSATIVIKNESDKELTSRRMV